MSYEGSVQVICEDGHYNRVDAPYGGFGVGPCDCGKKIVWENNIDETNGEDVGLINIDPFKKSEGIWHACSCGHNHLLNRSTFRVPTPEETKALRTYAQLNRQGVYEFFYESTGLPVHKEDK